jgi:hypothetical protein
MPESPDVFVNYRTGDEENAAAFIEDNLSRRFGGDRVFFASKSVRPGEHFPPRLLTAVRRCHVLLAVIGQHWVDFASTRGGRALDHADDWTRREIAEAFENRIPVIPVLVGRQTRLNPEELPEELASLAECQYLRFDHRNAQDSLARIADEVAQYVPGLAKQPQAEPQEAKATAADAPTEGTVHNSTGPVGRSSIQFRDVSARNMPVGDFASIVDHPSGTVHTGQGDVFHHSNPVSNAPQFYGDNVSYSAGDVTGDLTGQQRQEGKIDSYRETRQEKSPREHGEQGREGDNR